MRSREGKVFALKPVKKLAKDLKDLQLPVGQDG